jgi:hypothetical protein
MLPRGETSTYSSDEKTSTHTQKNKVEKQEKYADFLYVFEDDFKGVKIIKNDKLKNWIIEKENIKDNRSIKARINLLLSKEFIDETVEGDAYINKLEVTKKIESKEELEEKAEIVRRHLKGKKISGLEIKQLPIDVRRNLTSLPGEMVEEFMK